MSLTPIFKPDSPPTQSRDSVLTSGIFPLKIPLVPDPGQIWKPFPLFAGRTRNLSHVSCHASTLFPGHSPHPPHQHEDEEFLILLCGEADLIMPDNPETPCRAFHAGDFVYYPAGYSHTVKVTGTAPANYLMLKWTNSLKNPTSLLPFQAGSIRLPSGSPPPPDGFSLRPGFEGPTSYLSKLHLHHSTVTPGKGYEPHVDSHDVVLLMLEGCIEVFNQFAVPHTVVYCAAGEPHGLHNPGPLPARYLALEFHGIPTPPASSLTSIRQWVTSLLR
jgi:mannose-6-phosphate isomerase-like protein (cupin superfamily)